MDQMFAFALGAALWAGVCGAAFARGQWPERLAAAATLLTAVLNPLVQVRGSGHAQPGVWALDVALAATFLYIALKSDRWWPLFGAAFLLAGLIGHVVQATFSPLPIRLYATSEIIWAYLALFALAAGVLEIEQRRRPAALQDRLALPT